MDALPYSLYTNQQIRNLEKLAADRYHLSPETLMAYAGGAAFDVLQKTWPKARYIVVVCGAGNNAGDGYVLARLADEAGLHVMVAYLKDPAHLSGAALEAAQTCQRAGVAFESFHVSSLSGCDVIVDAVLGTGIKNAVSDPFQQVIEAMNAHEAPILSLDIPSGLQADTGCVQGAAIQAQATVTFLGLKLGLFTAEGPAVCGTLYYNDLTVPQAMFDHFPPAAERLHFESLKAEFPERTKDFHKGRCGHVLIIGGNYGMGGAVRMAAEAAGRVGSGLVSVATRKEHVTLIATERPEIMCHAIETLDDLDKLLKRATVIVIGPGLGKDDWAKTLWRVAIEAAQPKIVDADALNLLAEEPIRREDWILTPHVGEASRLLQCTPSEIQHDRFKAVSALQNTFGSVAVLKGAGSLIQGEASHPFVCDKGNPGMATGGMGDVLSGVLGGLVAQGLALLDAAKLGVTLHACAGDEAAKSGERGLLALDLMPYLRSLLA